MTGSCMLKIFSLHVMFPMTERGPEIIEKLAQLWCRTEGATHSSKKRIAGSHGATAWLHLEW